MTWDGRIRADARHIPLAGECVQCVVTSPPYWNLRTYDVDGPQIGSERTIDEYMQEIVSVFAEVWRVLSSDATLWLNIGDVYAAGGRGGGGSFMQSRGSSSWKNAAALNGWRSPPPGFKEKDLLGLPWRIAFALQASGWYLRSDIIWAKKNCMPESVGDRPTRSHEYIFLLAKSERYFYDAGAIAEPCDPKNSRDTTSPRRYRGQQPDSGFKNGRQFMTRNKRSVWSIGVQASTEAHYATFPEEIPDTCIRAGSRPGDLVLDPFFGSGTVGRVAERLSRRWVGLDLGYQDLQLKRIRNVQKELMPNGSL